MAESTGHGLDGDPRLEPLPPSISRDGTMARRAYHAIRSAVSHGELQPARTYSEGQVARLLNVSRTPAREALRQLEAEGLVEIVPQRGFSLRPIPSHEREEFFVLRRLLEGYAIETICERVEPERLETLRTFVERQRRALDDREEFIALDEAFHLTMAELAGLPRTARFISTLRGVLWLLGTEAIYQPERRVRVLDEHAALVEGLMARDTRRALEALERHLVSTASMLGIELASRLPREVPS
jgi:GntR family transcriptional regulator, rspAB operon transcriptional repressor